MIDRCIFGVRWPTVAATPLWIDPAVRRNSLKAVGVIFRALRWIGQSRFERNHINTTTDKPAKPIRAITANITARPRQPGSFIELSLNAVGDAGRLSVDCAPGRVFNEDDSLIGCMTVGVAAPQSRGFYLSSLALTNIRIDRLPVRCEPCGANFA
jgi:hypothetical protein